MKNCASTAVWHPPKTPEHKLILFGEFIHLLIHSWPCHCYNATGTKGEAFYLSHIHNSTVKLFSSHIPGSC